MASAGCLLDLMSSWMDRRRECANKLSTVASELQAEREKCVATRSVGSKMAELLRSSGTMREAEEEDAAANRICAEIQDQFQDLKRGSPSADVGDVSRYVTEEILRATAERSGFSVSELDLEAVMSVGQSGSRFGGDLQRYVVRMLAFFGLKVADSALSRALAESLNEMVTNVAASGVKPAAKGSATDTGDVPRRFFSHEDAREKWEAQVQSDHVNDISQSLRDTADGILKVVEELQQTFHRLSEAFEELKDVQECIEDPGCVCRRTALLKYAVKHCRNEDLRAWLQEEGGSDAFLGLVDLFQMMRTKIYRERRKKRTIRSREIDVVFVAHGGIRGTMIPSWKLLLLPTLLDVLLYEPWNCTIDATVAYGIAAGSIQLEHRCFGCERDCPQSRFHHDHTPTPVPPDWNRMSEAGEVPEIYVKSINPPKDGAWGDYVLLRKHNEIPDRDRVVIPFILPGHIEVWVPFTAVTLAVSLVLLFSRLKARLHLAACLNKGSPETHLDVPYLQWQYSCAPDHTRMSSSQQLHFPSEEDRQLFRNLRQMFG